jgi:hypothetical protein
MALDRVPSNRVRSIVRPPDSLLDPAVRSAVMDAGMRGTAPPGWYPDPSGATAWRWWDGYQWTGHVSPPIAQPPFPSAPPQPPVLQPSVPQQGVAQPPPWTQGGYVPAAVGPQAPLWPPVHRIPSVQERFSSEKDMAPWAKRAFVGLLAVTVLVAITAWPEGAWIRSVVDQVTSQIDSGVTNVTVNRPAGLTVVTSVILLLEIAIFVVLLNWQYSAAKTAQMLGLPAARGAGLGVGSWFIPVVNLWFPYQAIRDCLPPGDPGRRVVLRMWLCYLGAGVAGGVAIGLSYARAPIAIVVAEVAVGFAIGVAFNGIGAVQAIGDAHREMLGEPPGADQSVQGAVAPA